MGTQAGLPRQTIASPGPSAGAPAFRRSVGVNLLRSLRPSQWTKNLIIFAALIFGQRLFDLQSVERALGAFVVFCALSGVVYLVNDVVDREQDRWHPAKRGRPIASGALSTRTALVAASILGAAAVGSSFWMSTRFGLTALAYLGLLSTYSTRLKYIVIVDVLTIAIGFVLRATAGGVVIGVPVSQWLLCTILLALFLALSKRRHELVLLELHTSANA